MEKVKMPPLALAGWVSGLECCPAYGKAAGSIPGQGTHRRQPVDVSFSTLTLTFSLSLSLFLKPINVSSDEDKKNATTLQTAQSTEYN